MNLLSAIAASSATAKRWLHGRDHIIEVAKLQQNTFLGAPATAVAGRNVLLLCRDQLTVALALTALDGVAARILLCPPDVNVDHLPELAARAELNAIVGSADLIEQHSYTLNLPAILVDPAIPLPSNEGRAPVETAWLLLTSGTSGIPKVVQHSFAGLAAAMSIGPAASPLVWSTFYDIRRYGGLQIFLRAMTGGGSMVLSDADEPAIDFLRRLAGHKVTHISGTPSHWRRAVMSGHANLIDPTYVRMSGEIADQAIIDTLKSVYPTANIAHAYASTEAGVGFAVDDGLEGFPASLIDESKRGIDMRVVDGTLRIRSRGLASGYVGSTIALTDAEGYVDTGDVVECRDGRYYFCGRKGGIINIGGLKVHPEEVEAVINRHQAVQMSLVKGRKNMVMGEIVVAEVVVSPHHNSADPSAIKSDIIQYCRANLPAHKVPAILNLVPALAINKSGKVARAHA